MKQADIVIIGGGIVGLATAYRLGLDYPDRSVCVLEKEPDVGAHQTGHNSGVLHSGIYYKPGSLKATNCREGKRAMQEFCDREGIPYDICGKVIVAVDESEIPALERIFERGKENQVRCEMIDADQLRELEPHAAGIRAIHVPEAGIVDFRLVCFKLADCVRRAGGEVLTGFRVRDIHRRDDRVVLENGRESLSARYLVNCAGLYSDRIAKLTGQKPPARIVPFRGEYYELVPEAHDLCRNLIYPVPDPNFPFLGVHFTRMIDGGVECGPNAVLAFAREGYRKRDINVRDLGESLTYPGFLRLCARYWRMGLGEMHRSFSKRAFVRALQRLLPDVRSADLIRARAGVRAQAVSPDGSMVDDFLVLESEGVVNVANAPSPAATSALQIARHIVDRLVAQW